MTESINSLVSQLVRPEIQALHSYHVPDSSGLLKLDAMENPNPWPGELTEAWLKAISQVEVNRYPDPAASDVVKGLRDLLKLDALEAETGKSLDLLMGNGSDEIIQIIAMSMASQDRCIMAPEPSFVMYNMIARFVNMPYQGVELNSDFSLNCDRFLEAIEQHNPAVIFLAVPNNPTGNLFALDDVERVIRATNGLVVLDEAYMAFTDSDLLSLAAIYDNVVVMRTLSKVGLAGLRLGFLIGQQAWLNEFDKVRLPYNINVLTQVSASFALQHYERLKAQSDALRVCREMLFAELEEIAGISPFPSHANFILVRLENASAKDVFAKMKEAGVLIKCLDGAHPLLANTLRLTVGVADQNQKMLDALRLALS